jgi:Bacteriophage related domain of unknown function
MSIRDVRTAVRSFLTVNWQDTVIAYENEDYEPATDVDGELVPWLFVEVMGGLYEQVSIGAGSATANYWSASGQLWLHVFVASGSGADIASEHADDLAELFRGAELDPNISFGDISIASGAGESDGNNWRLSLSIEWTQG